MAIKIRSKDNEKKELDKFIHDMADKPYGVQERVERITISLDGLLFDKIDSIVRQRKRSKQFNRTIAAFMREAVEYYIENEEL